MGIPIQTAAQRVQLGFTRMQLSVDRAFQILSRPMSELLGVADQSGGLGTIRRGRGRSSSKYINIIKEDIYFSTITKLYQTGPYRTERSKYRFC